jgi:hypothetical protein
VAGRLATRASIQRPLHAHWVTGPSAQVRLPLLASWICPGGVVGVVLPFEVYQRFGAG